MASILIPPFPVSLAEPLALLPNALYVHPFQVPSSTVFPPSKVVFEAALAFVIRLLTGIRLTTIKKANTEATIFLTSFLILITRIPPSSLIRTFNQIRKRLAHSNIEYSFHSLY